MIDGNSEALAQHERELDKNAALEERALPYLVTLQEDAIRDLEFYLKEAVASDLVYWKKALVSGSLGKKEWDAIAQEFGVTIRSTVMDELPSFEALFEKAKEQAGGE